MTRAFSFGAPCLILVALAAFAATPAYAVASSICMRLTDRFIHPDVLVIGLSSTLVTTTAIAIGSAVRQVRRTRGVIGQLKQAQRSLPARVSRVGSAVGVRDQIDLVQSNDLIAFCYGLRSPRLLISTGLVDAFDDRELEAVLRHELAHARLLDPLRTLVARAIGAGLSFVPMSRSLVHAYLCRREIAADRVAVEQMGDSLPLASALQQTLLRRTAIDASGLAVGALSATDVRIDRLLGLQTSPAALMTRPSMLQVTFFSTLMALTACLLLASAHAASGVRPCVPC